MSFTGSSFIYYFFLLLLSFSQEPKIEKLENPYVKGYFTFPLSPGTTTSLSGSFGDIRINHFHAGLDIRTGGQEGKSVYAAAEGYVSRINISSGGYGNGLYITHPNGLTTVYGHLKEFSANIKNKILAKQYAQEEWQIDYFFEPSELPIKKGELVAFSGNTGGSGGPHLHFEIRDEDENTLDPSLFGFKEIKDNVAPVIEFISIRCMSTDAMVNGQFGTFDFPISKTKTGHYYINQNIEVWGDVGIELLSYDKSQTSPFKLGLKSIELRKDNIPNYKFDLGKLSFYNKIDMNLHANYERMVTRNQKLHKCYKEEGNSMSFYETNSKNGILDFRDNEKHQISLILKDSYENIRSFSFSINSKRNLTSEFGNILAPGETIREYRLGSFLKIVRKKSLAPIKFLDGNFALKLGPSYTNGREETFVIDLRENYFSSYINEKVTYPAPFTDEISTHFNKISNNDFELDFKETLYHPLYVKLKTENDKLLLDKDIYPIKGRFRSKWKLRRNEIDREKDRVYLTDGRRPNYVGGNWENNTIVFSPKEFGSYEILRDTNKPSITPRTLNSERLSFSIKDDLSGIKSFECLVDGKWVLMEYEYKNGLIWSEKLNNVPFKGELILTVTDNCNNQNIYKTTI